MSWSDCSTIRFTCSTCVVVIVYLSELWLRFSLQRSSRNSLFLYSIFCSFKCYVVSPWPPVSWLWRGQRGQDPPSLMIAWIVGNGLGLHDPVTYPLGKLNWIGSLPWGLVAEISWQRWIEVLTLSRQLRQSFTPIVYCLSYELLNDTLGCALGWSCTSHQHRWGRNGPLQRGWYVLVGHWFTNAHKPSSNTSRS